MGRVYDPKNYSYPLNEDMLLAYSLKEIFEQNPNDVFSKYKLKNAIYNVSLTLKAKRVTGELTPNVCDEIEDYFWGLIL